MTEDQDEDEAEEVQAEAGVEDQEGETDHTVEEQVHPQVERTQVNQHSSNSPKQKGSKMQL